MTATVIRLGLYVLAAAGFGAWTVAARGADLGGEFFAVYFTEYALSLDNVFMFLVVLSAFGIPAALQRRVVLIGIALAVVLRLSLIAVGAAAVERFDWLFLVFGVFLIWTGFKTARPDAGEDQEPRLVGFLRRLGVPAVAGAVAALAAVDIMFAVDSIPASFGLSSDPGVIMSANVFALLGLTELFSILSTLMDRLHYLPQGLAVILCFIGSKLIAGFLGFDIPALVGLAVVVGVLAAVVALSLRHRPGAEAPAEPALI